LKQQLQGELPMNVLYVNIQGIQTT